LVSINRVWGYDLTDNSPLLDNIAYRTTTQTDGFNLIRPEELRPVLFYSTILAFIKKKYGLNIISPLENRQEYTDLTVWCNAERISDIDFQELPILKSSFLFGWYDTKNITNILNYPDKYTISASVANNTFTVNKRPSPFRREGEWVEDAFQFRVRFNAVNITGDADSPEVVLQYVRKSDDVVFITDTFSLTGTAFDCVSQIDDTVFGASNSLEFYIRVKFNQPTSWASCDFRIFMRFYDGKVGLGRKEYAWFYYDNLNNNNSVLIATDRVDLIKSLPKIKVVDFLSSHFKAFNISVFDTSPDSSELFWLTPEDIESQNKVYSKAIIDYTKYADLKTVKKEVPNDYNYYNFKHATSDYFSNKRYVEAFALEYGQTVYPAIKPSDPQEFTVETSFSIVPPVTVKGATGLVTAYGFKDDSPTLLDTGETRYTPNYDELTLFYSHGSTECRTLAYLGVKITGWLPSGFIKTNGVYQLTGYIKVTPVNKNGYSFGFSVLKDNGVEYPNSLFSRYYAAQTDRLLDPNVLSQSFDLILPPSEIYLNDSATSFGAGVPSGFRLQNDIIIGENKFSIVDATIDVTTGNTKIKLLNY
jgi:hypothetical protein